MYICYMDIEAYINSGIIESYCLGFCTLDEAQQIEMLASQHPLIQVAINNVRNRYEEQIKRNAITPSSAVKKNVMLQVYKLHAATHKEFPPLIDDHLQTEELNKWITNQHYPVAEAPFNNLLISALPSTNTVINFFVTSIKGHEPEVHDNLIEYIYVIKGSCTMDFNGIKNKYDAGQLIRIEPQIIHSAIVTSEEPMRALVQRQLFS